MVLPIPHPCTSATAYFVILSSIERGSRINVGRVTRLRSAPGRNWLIMWESTVGSCPLVFCPRYSGTRNTAATTAATAVASAVNFVAYHFPGRRRRPSHRRPSCRVVLLRSKACCPHLHVTDVLVSCLPSSEVGVASHSFRRHDLLEIEPFLWVRP